MMIAANFTSQTVYSHPLPPIALCDASAKEIGGKASNLLELSKIEGITIPLWRVIKSAFSHQFLEENGIFPLIHQYKLDPSEVDRQEICRRINEGLISPQLQEEIKAHIETLGREIPLAVRSSGIVEDGKGSSCAGCYETVLNCKGQEEIERAVRFVWASAFSERADFTNFEMSVILQHMVDANVSGVASTCVLSNTYSGIEISAGLGLKCIVDGEPGDNWVIHPTGHYILEETKALPNLTLTPAEVVKIARHISIIYDHYQCHVDVEFALNQSRELIILQARPLVEQKALSTLQLIDEKSLSHFQLLAKGDFSVPGIAQGKMVFVPSLEALTSHRISLAPYDIVVTAITTNVWTQFLHGISGLVTKEGSPSSHPILLCRERGIPCVIGISEDFEELIKDDQSQITLDGWNRALYRGSVPLKDATRSDIDALFSPVKMSPWPNIDSILPQLIEKKMVVEHEGKHWRRTPTYPTVGFQRELNLLRFEQIPSIIGEGKQINYREIEGFACNELCPFEEYVSLFSGFSLERASHFLQGHHDCLKEFLSLAQTFKIDSEHWRQYINAYSRLRGFVWAGGALQSFAARRAEEIAILHGLPAYYYDKTAESLQREFHGLELDVAMREALQEARKKLPLDLPELFCDADSISKEVVTALSEQFRFEHNISLEKPVDLQTVYKSVRNTVLLPSRQKHSAQRDFLTGLPELKGWLRLSIESRILQCNSHHIDARGRGPVHRALKELGYSNIFEMSIREISTLFDLHTQV